MSKEYLEAFNIIKFNPDNVDGLQYLEAFKVIEQALKRLEAIENANPSEALEELFKTTYFGSAEEYKKIDNCYNTIKQALINFDLTKDFLKDLSKLTNETNLNKIMKKLQEQEKENARLKEILINGFRDKNGVFHEQTYLAFIDDEWCICDLKTDEWFLVKEVY